MVLARQVPGIYLAKNGTFPFASKKQASLVPLTLSGYGLGGPKTYICLYLRLLIVYLHGGRCRWTLIEGIRGGVSGPGTWDLWGKKRNFSFRSCPTAHLYTAATHSYALYPTIRRIVSYNRLDFVPYNTCDCRVQTPKAHNHCRLQA